MTCKKRNPYLLKRRTNSIRPKIPVNTAFWLDKPVFITELIDFILNTGTPSLVNERFFKQISFLV